jgi:transglutaminase/protease-like cytokinesis protein 3
MKKLIMLFLCLYAFYYLSQHQMIPSIDEMKSYFSIIDTNIQGQKSSQTISSPQNQQTANQSVSKQEQAASAPVAANQKYPSTKIQTYLVSVTNGKLIVTGKATPYGQFNKADGVILYIQEARANKKVTIKVPFNNGRINYSYPLTYTVGDVIINLDEYYNGVENDPNTVLGYAEYHLTDGDPYLLPSWMVQSDNPTLISLARSITNGKQTDVEKSRAIFEWVAKNINYNANLINDPNPPLYSALQTYQTRDVLCSGYADLSAALHRAVGIEAKVDYGENHAWNEIMLNGAWQTEDPTYGAGFINANTMKFVRSYHPAYFVKSDKHKAGEYPW